MALTKNDKYELVKEMLFLKFEGLCALCGDDLGKIWNIWYINPINSIITASGELKLGDDSYENKLPACKSCNGTRVHYHCDDFESFRKQLKSEFYFLSQEASFKKAVRYGVIKEGETNIIFHFEKTL